MVDVRFERVIALPTPALPNTLYFVKPAAASAVALYASDVNGRPFPVGTGESLAIELANQAMEAAQAALAASQNPRTIQSVAIVGGHLIVTFSDGTTQDAGPIGTALNTILNTLAGSTLPSAQVEGEPAIYAALYPRLSAVKAQILAARDRRIALTARVVVLEGGTPSATATPAPSSDPTYDPAATVVVNAQRWSDFLDSVIALATSEDLAWAALRTRIEALKNPPQPRAFFSDPFFADPFFTRA